MPGKDKKYAVEGMRVKCSMGTTMCTLNTMGHGVTHQGKAVLNANDHIPMVNITTFGTCINKPCVPVTPLAWRFCNEEHMIDGAPALTTDSLCNCALGGVISIVDNSVSMGGIGAQSVKSGYVHNGEDARDDLKSSTEIVDNTEKKVDNTAHDEKLKVSEKGKSYVEHIVDITNFNRNQSSKASRVDTSYVNKQNDLQMQDESLYVSNKAHTLSDKNRNTLGTGSGGFASSERILIGEIDYEKASEAINYFNSEIKNRTVENAIVVDKTGRVFQFIGDTNNVSFDDIDLDGAYITHNHPESNGILSFGKNDFEFLKANQKITLLGCCNSKYEYFIKVLKDISDVNYNDIYISGFKYAFDSDYESQDAAMKILAERGYIEYVKRRIE